MRVLIVGYGRMGKEVEKKLIERGHSISAVVDPFVEGAEKKLTPGLLENTEMAIEFSLPDGIVENVEMYARYKVPAVIGTTGWDSERANVRKIILDNNASLLWGSNFAIGAHMFLYLTGKAAALLNSIPGYDIWLHETHHNKKKDSPSGTALAAAGRVLENYSGKTEIMPDKLDRQIRENELHVSSSRGGFVHGTHSVILDSMNDTIEITHRARNRCGLAIGSVLAAEWLINKKGFYSVEDFIDELIPGGRK
ncbi:MAG: 4-hydroxy-tetrahydrodipicolinate reductase [Spirochaetales bacterium]|nr:4-hydroxy-tetrahydrodipicolinate reductase [Spirochaetales bacterium]